MLDLVIGRDQELEALIDTLGKRRSNNPILIGPPGVGKTAIVEGLAVKIARGDLEGLTLPGQVSLRIGYGLIGSGDQPSRCLQ